jgi:hypothetical protein
MMATSGGNFLFAVNGVDSAKTFDGATWAVPGITVATSATWNYIALHKRRIWAVEKNTMNLWYLPWTRLQARQPISLSARSLKRAVTLLLLDRGPLIMAAELMTS